MKDPVTIAFVEGLGEDILQEWLDGHYFTAGDEGSQRRIQHVGDSDSNEYVVSGSMDGYHPERRFKISVVAEEVV